MTHNSHDDTLARRLASSLDTDGYMVIRGALDPEYCASAGREVIAEYERLISLGWKFHGGGRRTGHLSFTPSLHGPRITAMLREGGYFEAAERYVGTPLSVVHYVGNMNLPGSRLQEMHQDYPPAEEKIKFNVVLVDTTPANGATELVPRSQGDHYTYRTLHSTGAAHTTQMLTGKPGDVVIRFGTLWHRGTVNSSAEPRPLFGLLTESSVAPQEDPPCDAPIGFFANRFYGPRDWLLELREIYAAPLIHTARKLKS